MKRTMAIVIAIVTLMCALCLVACSGSYGSDTFEGALSVESFNSEEDALKGFLANEISGSAAKATLVDYEEKKELSTDEIDKLVLGELDKSSIVSAKEVEISYNRGSVKATATEDEEESFLFTVYILEISGDGVEVHEFKYYVPKAKNGDVLTRSYFADVLAPEKYINCTQEYTSEMTSQVNGKTILEVEQKYTIKVAGNKAFMDAKIFDPTSIDMSQLEQQEVKYNYMKVYFEFDEETKTFSAYGSANDAPYVEISLRNGDLAQFNIKDMESFATMNLPKIDYSYYEKTNFGFKIQEAFLNKYVEMSMGTLVPNSKVDCKLNVYVTKGRVGKMESDSDVKMPMYGVEARSQSKGLLTFKDFGTTEVTAPEGVPAK